MQRNSFQESRLHVHYSTNAFNSFGVAFEDSHQLDYTYAGLQWNRLLKRRNTRYSQANLYLRSQLGVLRNAGSDRLAGTIGISADWETRRYFTSYAANYREADNLDEFNFSQQARIGIAPYIAEYGNWHTWLMLQLDHQRDREDELTLTPMVRLFRSNYLFEFGISENEDLMFNWVVRY